MIETDRDYRKQLTSCDMRFDICAVGLKRLVARHIMLLCPVILSPFVMSLPLFHFAALLTWIAPVENRPQANATYEPMQYIQTAFVSIGWQFDHTT